MGIKGIYKEIGTGARIAFLRLAVDSVERRGRPLRLAIDISIWQFQVQAARGGSNPAVRALFYRLVRLLGMPVQPIFVFDGPNKPLFKRNKRSAGPGDTVGAAMAKRMIRMFGFYIHDAPGEAEAECALLQQRGVVDAVLSEDVDTLMFGCTRTLRNWSAATSTSSGKGSSTAAVTHVTMYETDRHLPTATGDAVDPAVVPEAVLRASETGLDREGMVLVALMSGGDYIPEGVPGCGVKLACEAAKAGFGRSLCRLKRSDTAAFAQWRATLQHELRTNESKFFRTLHHKLVIPDEFPNLDVLRYYTHPAVSPSDVVERVRAELAVHCTPQAAYAAAAGLGGTRTALDIKPIDVLGLRAFVADTFDWTCRGGAIKFVRVLAPGLLTRMLLLKWSSDYGKTDDDDEGLDGEVITEDSELFPRLVEGISRQRTHASTDDTPELRVSFVPLTVVGIDLSRELDDPETAFGRDGIALNSDDDFDEPPPTAATQTNLNTQTVASSRAMSTAAPYDPAVAKVAWIPRSILAIGAPGVLEEWDQKQQRTKKPAAKAKAGTGAKTKSARGRQVGSAMPDGALDKYVRVTKDADKSPAKAAADQSVSAGASKAVFKPVPDFSSDSDSDEGVLVPPETQPPRRAGGNSWSLTGSNKPRVTKNAVSSSQSRSRSQKQKAKETQSTTPVKRTTRKRALAETPTTTKTKTQPDIISLLSSDLVPAPVDVPTSPIASSLPRLPDSSGSSPKPTRPRRRQAASTSFTSSTSWIMSSPSKQTSIRDYMSSQASQASPSLPRHKKPMAILLSDDEDEDDEGGTPLHENDDPFSSSPPVSAAVGKSKAGKTTAPSKTKTRFVPRPSDVGYFREEAEAQPEDVFDWDGQGGQGGQDSQGQRRGWRLSEVGVVDLTGVGL